MGIICPGHMTNMATMSIYRKAYKNLLLQTQKSNDIETWHEASLTRATEKCYINDDPGLTLTDFTARSILVAYAFEWGKLLQSHLIGITCSK